MSLSAEKDRQDQELAAAAIAKRNRGEKPSARESAALLRIRKKKDEEDARRHYAAMPKRIYRELSGRKDKVILEQAASYGMPIAGAEVDLGRLLPWIHDFLARNKFKLTAAVEGESFEWMPEAQKQRLGEEQIRKTREQANILELERQEKEKKLLPLEAVHEMHARLAGVLRVFSDQLQKTFGDDARKMFDKALDAAQRSVNSLLDESLLENQEPDIKNGSGDSPTTGAVPPGGV